MTEVSIQDKLQAALEAEAKGLPIDWKTLCVNTYNAAMDEIKRLSVDAETQQED